jgi:acetate kinase
LKILVTNCGSSSLKGKLFDEQGRVLASGQVAGLASRDSTAQLQVVAGERVEKREVEATSHDQAFDVLAREILGAADDPELDAVGHRVVHGGERFSRATQIDDEVEAAIEALVPLAPLHNPLCLEGIRAARRAFPQAQHVAVFDTAFHQTLPEAAYLYALPHDTYERDGVRRYGFHGSSHRSVSERAIEWLGGSAEGTRIITCHLGAGCSTAAIRDGRSVDTSMGMTPLEGLVMSTRSGDVDPGVFAYLARRRGLDATGVEAMLQNESGLLGLSQTTGDLKQLLEDARGGRAPAARALGVFTHRVRRYIGAHLAVLGGADALVFTGGAGENSPELRARILEDLGGLGFVLDPARNEAHAGNSGTISHDDSPCAIYVIEADEERAIADEARTLLEAQSSSSVR